MNNYVIRELTNNDYDEFIKLINEFKKTTFDKLVFNTILNLINKTSTIWIIELNNKLIATATIIYEYKFIHNISICAHVEDVCVSKNFRGNNYGKILVNHMINEAIMKGCYKVILDCDDNNSEFYRKCGLEKKGLYMVKYFDIL